MRQTKPAFFQIGSGALLCVALASTLCGQDSRPAGKTLIDYFLPMPITDSLDAKAWGAANVLPRDPKNGLEDPTLKQWYYWDGQIIKGPDGKFHMFASRWDQARGHRGRGGSVAIHAVSDSVNGPYIDKGPCWPDDQKGRGHNVTVIAFRNLRNLR